MLVRALLVVSLVLLSAVAARAQSAPPAAAPPGAASEPPQSLVPSPASPPVIETSPPQAPPSPEPQPARTFCGEDVSFRLTDPATVPAQYRRFVGVWSDAAWDARTCAALIVEDVKPDGTASIIYIYGPQGENSPITGALLHGTGVIRAGELRFQNSDGSQFAFRPGVADMTGHWINPRGESFQAAFKQTP